MYLGDFAPAVTVGLKFTTVDSTGAPTTLSGTPAVKCYKRGDATEVTTGISLTADYDSKTGLNDVVVDTSADGTFYAAGGDFVLFISAGTVSGVSVVGYVVGAFSLNARSALRPTTAGRQLDVSAGGEAGVDWANVGSPTTTLNLSGTTVKEVTDVETKLGTPALASVSADIAALPTAAENAEYLLKLDLSTLTGEAARSLLNAVRLLRNKTTVVAGVLTVYKEDDTTSAWSGAVGTDASADPIVSIDPS